MSYIICIILSAVSVQCLIPPVTEWINTVREYYRRRRKLYKEYSIRRSDYEEYRCFMECCERKYQVKVINGLLYEMKEMQKEMFS